MSPGRIATGRLLPALLLLLAGCAGIPETARQLPDPDVVVELVDTPFFPQKKYQCGPAALATVLNASAVDVSPGDLVASVYLPARKGSLQIELLATTRNSKRIPLIVDSSLGGLANELRHGRAVVVLQNLGVAMIPRWHYAVVVGIDGPNRTVVLRSGIDQRRETPFDVFLRTWARGEFWAFSVLRPGQVPVGVDRERYVTAVADLEEVGMTEEASLAWEAGLERWPGDPVIRFGLGNTLLSLDRPRDAEQVYRQLLAERPDLIVARNNLALALSHQARFDEALSEIDDALREVRDPVLAGELLDTKQRIQSAREASHQ